MLPPAPPPLTELERLVLAAGYPARMGIDEASDNVRRWLRAEIDRQLRDDADRERAEERKQPARAAQTAAVKWVELLTDSPEGF